jgi:hypothetical protein
MAVKKENIEKVVQICDMVVNDRLSFLEALNKFNSLQDDPKDGLTLVTFYKAIAENPDIAIIYNYAREVRADVLFEELVQIADTPILGEEFEEAMTKDEEGNETVEVVKIKRGDMIRHRQLQIDTRKWVVSKMLPKKYGDKIDLTSLGEKLNGQNQPPLTPDQMNKLIEKL